MKSLTKRLLMAWLIVFAVAPMAFAGILSPFSFSFYNSFLNNWFLLPFTLGGCF